MSWWTGKKKQQELDTETQFNVQAVASAPNPPNVDNPQNQRGGGCGSGNTGEFSETSFSLNPGGANQGIINNAGKNGFNHWIGVTAKIEKQL